MCEFSDEQQTYIVKAANIAENFRVLYEEFGTDWYIDWENTDEIEIAFYSEENAQLAKEMLQ